jgi:hypothetical protein
MCYSLDSRQRKKQHTERLEDEKKKLMALINEMEEEINDLTAKLPRGNGIRKKNARFDIPAERVLGNIDQLVAQSTDEQEIKELKQQKWLLRNRQAA